MHDSLSYSLRKDFKDVDFEGKEGGGHGFVPTKNSVPSGGKQEEGCSVISCSSFLMSWLVISALRNDFALASTNATVHEIR